MRHFAAIKLHIASDNQLKEAHQQRAREDEGAWIWWGYNSEFVKSYSLSIRIPCVA
jgi:hypothetical protein